MAKGMGELPQHVASPDPSIYGSNNYVVLDFETTNLDKGSAINPENRLLLAVWRLGPDHPDTHPESSLRAVRSPRSVRGCDVRWGGEYDMEQLVRSIERADFIVAHNAKFELGWLRRCGVDLYSTVVFDTMLGEYVLAGNGLGIRDLSLEKSLGRYGFAGKVGSPAWMIRIGWPVEDIPRKWLEKYCVGDVEGCEKLFLKQRELLAEKELMSIQYQRCLLTPALAHMEFQGMQLDVDMVYKLEAEEEERYVKLTNQITQFCGGIEPSKSKQLAVFVYEDLGFKVPRDYRGKELRTPSGDYSVAAPVMENLVARTKRQREFLALYKRWTHSYARLTKYLRKFGDCCREDNGLLRGVFNQCNTRTHRLSSGGARHRVQFQNFSRDFKPLFCARKDGWLVGESDGAQLEFRVAVHLGRDRVGLHYIIADDSDIHRFTASVLNNIPESEVTGDQRQAAKPDTFKPLYGGSSGTPAQQRYYAAFKEQYKGIAGTQLGWTQTVLRDKKLRTEWGLVYHWPNTRQQQSGYITNTTSIYNYPVQAFATAEIIPLAIVCAWHRMKGMESFLVNTVHDSIIAEVHPDEQELWHDLANQCLIQDVYGLVRRLYNVALTVPLGAGVMLGSHWGSKEAKQSEVVYEADEQLWKEAAQEANML